MNTVKKTPVSVRRGEVFRMHASRPDAWEFNGKCIAQASACELCGTAIVWRYGLENQDTKKVLLVGSECIKWYYEAWMPNGLQMMVEKMKAARRLTKAEVIKAKLEQWTSQDPWFKTVTDFLFDQASRGEFRLVQTTKDGEEVTYSTSRYRASLRRKGYLRPDEMEELRGNVTAWQGLIQAVA